MRRKYYITIQVATRTSDSQGGYTTAWADTYYEWAVVNFLSESRILDQGGIKYTKSVHFEIRNRDDYTLSEAHRIKWDSVYYTIHSVIPSQKMNNLIILAYA